MRTTPRPFLVLLALCLVLTAAGCSHMPRMLGGSPDVTLTLDGEQNYETGLPPGHTLTLDLRDPGKSGYVFAGVTFDTDLLRLDGILPYDAGARVRYVFVAIKPGQCQVLIKIRRKEPGNKPEVFKRVNVVVGQ